MIVVLKYNKCDNMVYASHIDLLRYFIRAFRRTGLNIDFSLGFNPHMLINLGTPLPLGINSCSEYITISTDASAKEVIKKYNEVAAVGMNAIACFDTVVNPNIAGRTVAADYSINHTGAMSYKKQIDNIVNLQSYEIEFMRKGEIVTKDVIKLINGIRVSENNINVCIGAGNTTLRIDHLSKAIASKFNFCVDTTSLWKYNQYVRENGILMEVDEYLISLEKKFINKKTS